MVEVKAEDSLSGFSWAAWFAVCIIHELFFVMHPLPVLSRTDQLLRGFLPGVAVCLALFLLSVPAARAADGSGTATISATTTVTGAEENTFTITYTATESMGDGSVRLTIPGPWPEGWSAPIDTPDSVGYTTVSVSTGTSPTVLNVLDGTSGWGTNSGLVTLASDTSVKQEGSASLSASITLSLGTTRIYENFGSAQDWSGLTHVGFWVRSTTALNLGAISFVISESANTSVTSQSYSLPALSAGAWTYVTVPLSQVTSTRDAVLSYGFTLPITALQTYHFDAISVGPGGSPVYSDQSVTIPLMGIPAGATVTFTYGAGGGTNGGYAPLPAGKQTFQVDSRISSGGTLTSIASSPTVTVYPTNCMFYAITGPEEVTAGTPAELHITVLDSYANICNIGPNAYVGNHSVTFTGVADSPDGVSPTMEGVDLESSVTVPFVAGQSATGSLTFVPAAAEGIVVYASDGMIGTVPDYGVPHPISVVPDVATKLTFAQAMDPWFMERIFDPAIRVDARDAYGNIATTTHDVELELAPNASPATLDGTLEREMTEGTALFDDLLLSATGTSFQFLASSPGLASATSTSFDASIPPVPATFVDSAILTGNSSSSLVITKDFTATGTDRYLFLTFFTNEGDSEVTNVTWNGEPMTQLAHHLPLGDFEMYLYGLPDPDVGAAYDAVIEVNGAWVRRGMLLLYAGASSTQPGNAEIRNIVAESLPVTYTVTPSVLGTPMLAIIDTGGNSQAITPLNGEQIRADEAGLAAIESGPWYRTTDTTVSFNAEYLTQFGFAFSVAPSWEPPM